MTEWLWAPWVPSAGTFFACAAAKKTMNEPTDGAKTFRTLKALVNQYTRIENPSSVSPGQRRCHTPRARSRAVRPRRFHLRAEVRRLPRARAYRARHLPARFPKQEHFSAIRPARPCDRPHDP